ncbi:MAG TPA: hypothetical protein VHW01_07030 [Polyangiaceae bacterium]|jgi:hypothetical protein|nr:hypothetical protein [Polyangiaceae bacterium]
MATKVKGMVQLEGMTYRIVRVAAGSYSVVRIRDDVDVGGFETKPGLPLDARVVEPALLRQIAQTAIHAAKTSYRGFPRVLPPAVSSNASSSRNSKPPPTPALA